MSDADCVVAVTAEPIAPVDASFDKAIAALAFTFALQIDPSAIFVFVTLEFASFASLILASISFVLACIDALVIFAFVMQE